jgi:hypothetical protein
MIADILQQYEYLWKRSDPNWALLKAPNLLGGYCVFNKLGSLLAIESAEVNEAVCKRMKDAGCEVLESVPKSVGCLTDS